MGQTQEVDASPEQIAKKLAGTDTEITPQGSFADRHEFGYKGGCIQAHKLPSDWEFVGFGSRWFAIHPK